MNGTFKQGSQALLTALLCWRGGRGHREGCSAVQLVQMPSVLAAAVASVQGWHQESVPSNEGPRALWSPPETKGQVSSFGEMDGSETVSEQ